MRSLNSFAWVFVLLSATAVHAQQASKAGFPSWLAQSENLPGKIKAFEENKGQYPDSANGSRVLYGCFHDGVTILFTEKGLTYAMKEVLKKKYEENEEHENTQEEEEERERRKYETRAHTISIEWENPNPDLNIETVEETPFYFGVKENQFKGYRKLVYRNVYPGIDVVFSFHPERGIKYDITVKPGSDVGAFAMKYSGRKGLNVDQSGDLHIKTPLGDIIDHAPVSTQSGKEIITSFEKINDRLVKFQLGSLDPSAELVIDPWLTSPTTGTAGFAPVNVGVDASNNVYILGAYSPASWDIRQFVQKYNTTGVLQWTYQLTEFQGTNGDYWLADLAVSPVGEAYVASQFQFSRAAACGGNEYAMVCLNTTGTRKYFYCGAGTNSSIFETWNLAHNCSFTTLIQAGCAPSPNNTAQACVINTATGAIYPITRNNTVGELYAGTIGPDGNYYALAADSNINATTYQATSGPHNKLLCYQITGTAMNLLWWTNTNYTFVDFTSHMPLSLGTNGVGVGCNYIYTSDGTNLDQRNLNNGTLIKRVTITGGSTVGPNINSGIAVDPLCGFVYIGSKGAVYTYDPNLNLVGTYTVGTNNIVFDVKVKNGIVSFCGATKSNGSAPSETVGVGFVGQFDAKTCATPLVITHTNSGPGCPGTATANPSFCAAPFSYSWAPGGQTTQTATGLSPGTYTVTVSTQNTCLSVTDTVTIFSAPCSGITVSALGGTVCKGGCTTVNATASSGTAPYTYVWSSGQSTSSINVCPSATTVYTVTITDGNGSSATSTATVTINTSPVATISPGTTICAGSSYTFTAGGGGTYSWNTGSSASSIVITPSGSSGYTVWVTSAAGCKDSISANITVTPGINPTVTPAVICAGDSALVTASGGNTYSWNTGSTASSITVSPSSTTSYTVLVTAGSCSATAIATVTVSTGISTSVSGNTTICAGSSTTLVASGGSSFSWSTGQSSASIVVTPTSNASYSVWASSGTCLDSANIAVVVNPKPTASATSATICSGQPATLTASGGASYSWNPGGGNSSAITVNPSSTTNYTVVVSNAGGCTDVAFATVSVNQAPVTSISGNTSLCSGQSTTLTANGGGNYSWNTGSTTASIGFTPGSSATYTVIVTNAGGCTAAASINVYVTPTPTASISAPVTICEGTSVTVSAGGGGNYSWVPGGNSSSSFATSPSATTTYSVVVSMGACSDTASTTITVNTAPAFTVSGNTMLCRGDATTLTATGGTTYSWSNGATTASINIAPSSSVSYTLIVTSAAGCTAVTTVPVTVMPPPVAGLTSATICAGQTTTLLASGGGNYLWSTGATTSSITVSPSASSGYSVLVSIGTCTSAATSSVTVNPNPTASAFGSITITQGQSTTLSAAGGTTYIWDNGAAGSTILVSPTTTTIYCVTVRNTYGCQDSACVNVVVEPIDCSFGATGEFFIPNAFTPNEDNDNDVVKLLYGNYACIKTYEFTVYNRWGEKIYETEDPLGMWDGSYRGKMENPAVFVWHMKATLIDGTEIARKGNISLMR